MLRRNVPLTISLLLLIGLAGVPILWMFLESIGIPHGLDFGAYGRILATETERAQLGNTVILGVLSVGIATILGGGTALLCFRSDLPGARWLGPASMLPLLFPPVIVAYAFDDLAKVKGLPAVALILAVSHAPFVVALAARGLRSVDGRLYEAVLVARGRLRAELFLVRQILADLLAGALLVFVFVIANHAVPEFFSVKLKTWHTYSEAIFLKWGARGAGPGMVRGTLSAEEAASQSSADAVATSIPLLVITILGLWLCLRARKRGTLVTLASDFRPVPRRRLGLWRAPALLFVLILPFIGLFLPAWRMLRWTSGAMTHPASERGFQTIQASFEQLFARAGSELQITVVVSICVALAVVCVGLPLAWNSARKRHPWIEALSLAPLAVPSILLGIGFIRVWNRPGDIIDVYDSKLMVVMAYATRFLPIGVLALANAVRRVPPEMNEAAQLTGHGPIRRFWTCTLPPLLPAMVSTAILAFILSLRELDLAAVLLPGNDMLSRRLSNIVHFNSEDYGGAIALTLLFLAALPLLLRVLLTGRAGRAIE